jgi:hypothetical protein
MIRRVTRTVAVLLLSAAVSISSSFPSQVRPIDLEQMTQRAARIFSGRCTGSRIEVDPALNRRVVVSTFHVQRAVKGVKGGPVTVRMLAGPASAPGSEPAGVPTFRPGEEVVLFLYGESTLGLTSPVGLGQGRFRIFSDKLGRKVALNDFGNANLSRGGGQSPPGAHRGAAPGAALGADDLLDRVERLVGGER